MSYMKKIRTMKQLKNLIVVLGLCSLLLGFASCKHKSEMIYHTLPVEKEYEALTYVFDWNEISKEELQELPNLQLVINSDDDFPEENLMGLEELKESDIDFKNFTLLLVYHRVHGVVGSYNYKYAKDFENDTVIFSIIYQLDRDFTEKTEIAELFTYCRSAILVAKITEGTEVEFRLSY